jgi:hypothetical protein
MEQSMPAMAANTTQRHRNRIIHSDFIATTQAAPARQSKLRVSPHLNQPQVAGASLLQGFKLLERFQDIFAGLDARRTKSPRELDPRRKFGTAEYFSMELFTLLNPLIETCNTRSHAWVLVKHSTSNHSIPFRKSLALQSSSPAPAAAQPRVFLAPLLRFAPKRSWQCGFVREKHRRLAGVLDKSAATRGKVPKARKAGLSQSFHGTSHHPRLFMLTAVRITR